MRKTLTSIILSGAVLTAWAGSSLAADVVTESYYDWTGAYVGVHAGMAHVDSEGTDLNGWLVFPDEVNTISVQEDGLTGGVQAGYNLQMDHIVLGVEGDFSFLGVSGETTSSLADDNSLSIDNGYLATLRGRLGFAFDRFLVYGTGGFAYGDVGSEWIDDGGTYQFTRSVDAQWGWTAGGGVEYAFTDAIPFKAEYLYFDLGDDTVSYNDGPDSYCSPFAGGCDFEIENSGYTITAGLNFHF